MKTKIFLTFAATALMLSACKKENKIDTPWNGEIYLTTATSVMTTQSRAASSLQNQQFVSGESVSVFINENSGTSTSYTQPLVFTTDGNGGLSNNTTQYFPQSGNGVDIYACYPNDAASQVTATKDFSIQTDQSTDLNYKKSDLMLGLPTNNNPVTRTSDPVGLTFTHQLSKIDIELVAGAGLENSDLNNAVVKLKSIKPTITFNPKTGVTNTASGNATDIKVMKATASTLTGSAIIIPQEITQNTTFIEVTLSNGGVLTHKLANTTSFATKTQYGYKITVKLTGIEVSTTITDWTPIGNVIVGDATM